MDPTSVFESAYARVVLNGGDIEIYARERTPVRVFWWGATFTGDTPLAVVEATIRAAVDAA